MFFIVSIFRVKVNMEDLYLFSFIFSCCSVCDLTGRNSQEWMCTG